MKVGVDLGTTNSVIARLDEDGEPDLIRNAEGEVKTRSIVQFREDEDFPLVGTPAVRERNVYPEQTVDKVKRHMGDADWSVEILGEKYSPESISARILRKLFDDAESETGENIEKVVITVPADFGTRQREATINAAKMANEELEESDISLLTEPVAACLRYGADESSNQTIFVYDLGGGTFDATIVDIDGEDFSVDGTKGAQRLGGEDFDEKLYEYVRQQMLDDGDPDPEEAENLKSEVYSKVREVKHGLSAGKEASMGLSLGPGEVKEFTIDRDKFEELTGDLVEDSIDEVDKLFQDENVDAGKEDIDRVLMVGGASRIPIVQDRVEEYFGFEPSKDLEQDFVVGEGAAIQTERATWEDTGGPDTKTVLPETIGVAVKEDDNMVFSEIMEENTTIPEDGKTKSKDGYKKDDVNATQIEIEILEGGEPLAEQNDHLADFTLENLEKGKNPEFEIEFEITSEARLTAEVRNLDTGQSADHTLDIGLDQEQIGSEQSTIARESEAKSTSLSES